MAIVSYGSGEWVVANMDEGPDKARARSKTHEYAILLTDGFVFYTSGWDDLVQWIKDLKEDGVRKSMDIAGSYDPDCGGYFETEIWLSRIISVIDMRTYLSNNEARG